MIKVQVGLQHRYIVHPNGSVAPVLGKWMPTYEDDLGPRVLRLALRLARQLGYQVEYESDMSRRFYLRSQAFELFNYCRRDEDAFWMPRIPRDWKTAVTVIREHVMFAQEEGFSWFYLQAFGNDERLRYIATNCGLTPSDNRTRKGPRQIWDTCGTPNWYKYLGVPEVTRSEEVMA